MKYAVAEGLATAPEAGALGGLSVGIDQVQYQTQQEPRDACAHGHSSVRWEQACRVCKKSFMFILLNRDGALDWTGALWRPADCFNRRS